MDVIVPMLVQLVAGAIGGNVIGQIAPPLHLGILGNALAGAIGGVGATVLVSRVPGLVSLVDATPGAPGIVNNIDLGALAGQGAVGLVGGGLLTAIVGFIKSKLAKT